MAEKDGTAYAFFDCDASREKIDTSLPYIRQDAITPEGLQMFLHEGTSGLHLDKTLSQLIQYPDDYRVLLHKRFNQPHEEEKRSLASMKYALVANYKGASNEDAANELGSVLILLHSGLNTDKELFRGAVVYEKDGEYHLRGYSSKGI